jgi:DnaJ homolog subfamily C member 3
MRLISSTTLLSTLLTVAPHVLGGDNIVANNSGPELDTAQLLKPLVIRANVLLSSGQFADAAKTYTEAIELAPTDYVLYFKRANAYLSHNRHAPALEDFDTVLKLTDGTFDGAVMAKAKIFAKEGRWVESREVLTEFSKKSPGDKSAQELVRVSFFEPLTIPPRCYLCCWALICHSPFVTLY